MRLSLYSTHWLTTILLTSVLVFVGGCATGSSVSQRPTAYPTFPPSPTPLPETFPAFHDWRALYLAPDTHFHAITLDGKTDIIGPSFSGFSGLGTSLISAGVSPDGHFIAYEDKYLNIVDIHTQPAHTPAQYSGPEYASVHMAWSPDNLHLAIGPDAFDSSSIHIVSDTGSSITDAGAVPNTKVAGGNPTIQLIGWIDNQTLLTEMPSFQNTTTFTQIIQATDITTGTTRFLTAFPHAEQSNAFFTVSPDGKEALRYNFPAHAMSFTPTAEILDTTTSAVHELANLDTLAAQHGTWISGATWRPGTHTLAVTLGFDDQQGVTMSDYLVNTDTDTETPFPASDYVERWSPDGTTLVLSNTATNENRTNQGPFTLTAVTFSASGQATFTPLTKQSMAFTFLGFVRSA